MSDWVSNYTGPKEVKQALEAGRPLMLVARNSAHGGKRGRDLAAQELHSTAAALKQQLGIDITKEIPRKAELISRLRQAPSVKSVQSDGRTFLHEYVHLQLCEGKVHVLIATGSGLKLTADFDQPFVGELVQTIKAVRPALVFCHLFDRLLRHAMSAAPLLTASEHLRVALADRYRAPFYPGGMEDMLTIWNASASQREATKIPVQTRNGMVSRTEKALVDGQCLYSLAPSPPAGFARLRMRSATEGLGDSLLILDDPACYPEPERVAVGRPRVTRDGLPVNQVQLIRHALTHLGKPGHTLADMGRYLAANHFSTDKLRSHHGPSAHFGLIDLDGSDYRPLRSILANLDVYETGEWTVQVNAGGYTSHTITNMLPLDGEPWATPEDFDRIRHILEHTSATGGTARLPLTGVSVTVDGVPGCLRVADEGRDASRTSYGVGGPRKVSRRFLFPALPHKLLADSIVEGLAEAADRIWIPADDALLDPQLRHERDRQRQVVARLERLVDALSDQIAELDEDGKPLLAPATRSELSKRQARLIEEEVEPARQTLYALEQRLVAEAKGRGDHALGTPVNLLHRLIESLGDPENLTYREWWKRSLTVDFHRKPIQKSGHEGYELTWEGVLSVHQDKQRFEIPFSGRYEVGCATKVGGRVESIIDQLREGVPFDEVTVERARDLRRDVAERLGLPRQLFVVGNMQDPRILRIAVHILENPEKTDAQVAEAFSEPAQLVARVRFVVTAHPSGYRWLRHSQPIIKTCLALAHTSDGHVTREAACQATGSGWGEIRRAFRLRLPEDSQMEADPGVSLRIPPCPHCASRRRSLSRLNEPIGFICLDCRLDQVGIPWPGQPYDEWMEAS